MEEELVSDVEDGSVSDVGGDSPVGGGSDEVDDVIDSDDEVKGGPSGSMPADSMADSMEEMGEDSMEEMPEPAKAPAPGPAPAPAPTPAPAPAPASSPSKRAAASSSSSPKRSPVKRSGSKPGGGIALEPSVDISELQTENATLRARVLELEEEVSKAAVTESQIQEMAARLERAEKAREELGEDGGYAEIRELEERLFEKGEELVEQAQKNYKLAERIRLMNEKLAEQRGTVDELRATLISGIAGADSDPNRYANVPTMDLLRIRTTKVDTGDDKVSFANTLSRTKGGARSGTPMSSRAPTPATAGTKSRGKLARSESKASIDAGGEDGGMDGTGSVSQIMAAEREIRQLKDRNRKLYDRIQRMDEAMAEADEVAAQNDTLRSQVHNYAERFRFEKENRAAMEEEVMSSNEKIEALSDHIEKLMNHLKHEAAAKAKAYETGRRAERELQLLRNRNAALAKRNSTREKVIVELKEGARILEDQLRLMDERYVELRGKLDWTRAHSQKEVKKIATQAEKLKMKWMAAQSLGVIPKHLMDSPKELKETTMA